MFLTISLAIVDIRWSSFDSPRARGGYHGADSTLPVTSFGLRCWAQWHWYFTNFKLLFFKRNRISPTNRSVCNAHRTESLVPNVQYEYTYRYTPNTHTYTLWSRWMLESDWLTNVLRCAIIFPFYPKMSGIQLLLSTVATHCVCFCIKALRTVFLIPLMLNFWPLPPAPTNIIMLNIIFAHQLQWVDFLLWVKGLKYCINYIWLKCLYWNILHSTYDKMVVEVKFCEGLPLVGNLLAVYDQSA